eukprot:TRINITY_DN3165_c4_g1_i1.p1 TRINITY_DN3165_c4_g1~~TRINITY_DN3165_c4_g1_i1.p1  ORF type:complete len:504 (+),score=176.13 TRINITY_DN3165_c4_g1_i1:136-1647(+)
MATLEVKNSLYVRNLSPAVTESVLRETFGHLDGIEKVTFKPYPSNESQFFAQIDFATSKGVAEGSQLSGTAILGVSCICGVIDPIAAAEQGRKQLIDNLQEEGKDDLAAQDLEIQAEQARKAKEIAEELRLRTVHVAGLAKDSKEDGLRRLCESFGEVDKIKVDEDGQGNTYALVEFKEQRVAHVVKMQKQFLVDERVLFFTEAKSHVDNCNVEEMTVQFQAPIIDAMNMKNVLSSDGLLNEKLQKVKAAAAALNSQLTGGDEGKKKKKKEKKEGKEGKKEKKEKKKIDGGADGDAEKRKKEKKEKVKEKKEDKKDKKEKKEKARKERKRSGSPAAKRKKESVAEEAAAEEEEVEEDSEEELVDLDEEVEVMHDSEVLGIKDHSSCSSTSSSESGEPDDVMIEEPVLGDDDSDVISDGSDVMEAEPSPKASPPGGTMDLDDSDGEVEAIGGTPPPVRRRPQPMMGRGFPGRGLARGRGLPLGRGRGLPPQPLRRPPPGGVMVL